MILVTGGTGFVGAHLARRLVREGRQVRLLVRDPGRVAADLRGQVETAPGDVRDAGSVCAAAQGADTVIHLVGIICESRGAGFEMMHVQATEHVLAACRDAGVRRYLHMSALGTRPNAASRYHRTKWQAEELVRASGLDWTIFRPSVIVGRGQDFTHQLLEVMGHAPVIPIIGSGQARLQPIGIDDVTACFRRALDQPQTIRQTYELGGPKTFTLEEIMDLLARYASLRKSTVYIPVALLRPAAWVIERLFRNPALTLDQLTMLQEDNICDIGAMKQAFGIEPESFQDLLTAMAKPAAR